MQIGTIQRLQSIDHATFERLADAVVAAANPVYQAVLHTGINAEGKTVVAPIDGFCLIPSSSPPHFVLVQHTTTAKKMLRTKWLRGCAGTQTKSARSDARKTSDLKKTWLLAEALRNDFPTAKFTVVLTTNQAVSEKLYSEVQKVGTHLGLNLDVWDQTRICRILDTSPTGHWLRWRYLGIAAQQLSLPLLRELSQRSLIRYRQTLASSQESWIRRGVENQIESLARHSTQLLLFLVGESGYGKSVVCARVFEQRCEANELCFWIPGEYLEVSPSLEESLFRAIALIQPGLWPGAADQLLHIVSKVSRLTLIVDDVNGGRNPAALIGKLIAWLYPRSTNHEVRNTSPVQVLCPVWPATADQFCARADTNIVWRQINIDVLDRSETHTAIFKAASIAKRILSPLDLEAIAAELGDDAYTIGLWAELLTANAAAPPIELAKNVQQRFFAQALARASAVASLPASVLDTSIREFAAEMLQRRNVRPTNDNIAEWFPKEAQIMTALVALLHHGYLMRMQAGGRILFRHDRVRDELLCRGLRLALDKAPELLREPFYARYLGRAASEEVLNETEAARMKAANAVALCEAFGWIDAAQPMRKQLLIDAALAWVHEEVVSERAYPAVIWEASAALFRSNAPSVLDITSEMPRNHYVMLARLRQGDVLSGAMLCGRSKGVFYPGIRAPQFENTVVHAIREHGGKLLRETKAALESDEQVTCDANGLLLMAGYIGDPMLLESIVSAWRQAPNRTHSVPFAVWAILRCAGGDGYAKLDELLTFWKNLSREPDEHGISEFWNVGSWLRRSFRWIERDESIRWLIRAAEENSSMEKVLAMLINEIDAPDAVEFAARYAGAVRKSLPKKNPVPLWLETRHWDPRESFGKRLSGESQLRLLKLWQTPTTDEDVRYVAFSTWSLGCDKTDLDVLRSIEQPDLLFERSVWTRGLLGDLNVVDDLAELLPTNAHLWWVADRVWTARIRAIAEASLDDLAQTMANDCRQYSDYRLHDIVEALVRIPTPEAGEVFDKFWPRLGRTRDFIIGALRIGTQCSRELAGESIGTCPPDINLFEHISLRITTSRTGEIHDPSVEARGLESLEPYIGRIWQADFDALVRDFCRGKHRAWCRKALFQRMSHQQRSMHFPTDEDLVAELNALLQCDVPKDPHFIQFHTRHWWEDLERREVAPERVWLAVRRSSETTVSAVGAEFVCELAAQFGLREELRLLHEVKQKACHFPGIARATENAAVALCLRVLN
jgi:hypothetical protein